MISPWSYDAVLPSPDGQKTVRIKDPGEIAMGGPTSATLIVSTGMTLESCSPSMVWSDDSRFLAVPRWTPDRAQQLAIVDVEQGTVRVLPGRYRVLQLESFDAGVVRGVDSPIYQPRPVAVAVAEHLARDP
ncbi:MAG TPA: hypothetical protein VFT45_00975 [Longimicrobium sp.]|nr:hypothetical protein [Longimicrobium sp.]